MAAPPPLVLLDRITHFVKEAITTTTATYDSSSSEEKKEEYGAAAAAAMGWTRVAGSCPLAVRGINPVMKPVPVLADPPRPSSLYFLLPPDEPVHIRPSSAEISTTHKGILVLRTILNDGYKLLYDVTTNALTVIPPLPDSRGGLHALVPLGCYTAVVVGDDDYIFADIVTSYDEETFDLALPQANIFTWSSSSSKNIAADNGRWVQSSVSQIPLPAHICGPDYHFQIDMNFSFHGRIFWVDLLQGILLCDLLEEGGPNLNFISLPDGCCIDVHRNLRHTLQPLCKRSMACVSGVIKFVALVGYDQTGCSDDKVMLKTWALSPDFKLWTEDTTALSVGDIWASESFNQMGLPHVMPISPMLSMTEDGIMYAILNVIDMEPLEQLNDFGECLGNRLVPKANYIIRFDIRQNKVLSYTIPSKEAELRWMQHTLLATDFTAYLQS
uniref:DUF1618 domain-containing protein n=1 Tax=Leersia perrieri TaxID=77586 RepID=A0A0D9UW19_9ORYZ